MFGMFRTKRQGIIYFIFLGLGLGITLYVFAGQDLGAMQTALAETHWGFVLLSLGLTLGGHWVRAMRWRQLVEGAGQQTTTAAAFWAMMNGYLVNLGVPRLGEVTRCASLNRLSAVPVATSGGTVVLERVIDLLTLLIVLVLTFFSTQGQLRIFFEQDIVQPLSEKLVTGRWLLAAGLIFLVLSAVAVLLFLRLQTQQRALVWLQNQLRELRLGLLSLVKMPGKGRFLAYTLLIWVSYFSAPWLMLHALGLVEGWGLEMGLVAFAVGSIARTIPAPAGSMGPYHWLVSRSLLLFGLTEAQGLALATLNHAVQTLFYLLVGGISFLAFAWLGRQST